MWTNLLFGTVAILIIEILMIRSFFMAVKRTIPLSYVVASFVFFSVEVFCRQFVKKLDYLSTIGQLDNLELEITVRIRRIFGDRRMHEMDVITLYGFFILSALIFALIFYKNRPLHFDFLNAAGLSFLLGPLLYLFRLFWWG
ncbi:MAG: hypothetical protein RIC30_16630 [Marinoscillum sp.]|uniref:hypothetical protein n=1 Tax=Marinoscillum sp. TaxID=2024838 RepID=UPI0032F40943